MKRGDEDEDDVEGNDNTRGEYQHLHSNVIEKMQQMMKEKQIDKSALEAFLQPVQVSVIEEFYVYIYENDRYRVMDGGDKVNLRS